MMANTMKTKSTTSTVVKKYEKKDHEIETNSMQTVFDIVIARNF